MESVSTLWPVDGIFDAIGVNSVVQLAAGVIQIWQSSVLTFFVYNEVGSGMQMSKWKASHLW
jgi:hypothetical protein